MARFGRRSTAEEVSEAVDLSGRHAVVTGANTGIGFETARVLALRGASVTLACRDVEKAAVARDRILRDHAGVGAGQVEISRLDLGDLAQVRSFAEAFLATDRSIDLLVNNAGVMLPSRRETRDGFEAHLGINHLGHFLLTNLLLERIRASAPARILNVSSDALHFATLGPGLDDLNWERRRYSGWRSYGDSKLMNVLFANELSRRLVADGVVAHALHPGIVQTELARDQPGWMLAIGLLAAPLSKSPAQGAATTLLMATDETLGREGGRYYADCAPAREHRLAHDERLARRLWERSEELVGLGSGAAR